MKPLFKLFATFFFVSISVFASNAQNTARQSMEKDFPLLMEKYGNFVESQHAHYIFAVDISSSMRAYESAVKENFLAFINAIPDGDEVTLIRVAGKEYTDYVGMYQCMKIDDNVRKDLKNVIYSPQFDFLDGGQKDGSDMYKMTELIIKAINTIGSNDLTFVYMFTDFEYWTKKYKYNPSRENWDQLKSEMPRQKKYAICKYGLELNAGRANLQQHAIVKKQLDDVFGSVDYQAVSSVRVLRAWFGHTIANVMAAKLNSLVKNDWNTFVESVNCEVDATSIGGVKASITCNPTDLVTELKVKADCNSSYIQNAPENTVEVSSKKSVSLGEYNVDKNSFLPTFKTIDAAPINVIVGYVSPYQNEISRLREVCKDSTYLQTISSYQLTVPEVSVWNSVLPLWLWIVIAVVILIIIVSILYTCFGIKLNREWQLIIRRRDSAGCSHMEHQSYVIAPTDINSYVNKRPAGDWAIRLYAKKFNPLNPFKFGKTGYYISLTSGAQFLDVMDPCNPKVSIQTLASGDECLICKHRSTESVVMQVKSTNGTYRIELM